MITADLHSYELRTWQNRLFHLHFPGRTTEDTDPEGDPEGEKNKTPDLLGSGVPPPEPDIHLIPSLRSSRKLYTNIPIVSGFSKSANIKTLRPSAF